MKKKYQPKGMFFCGSLRKAGITVYQKQGQLIARTAHSNQRRSCTRNQFIQRQRMRHTIALWQMLEYCRPMFTERKTAYHGFASLANRLPAVFVTKREAMDSPSFLMPDIPVSDGTLLSIKQRLGEVDGSPALLTSLVPSDMCNGDKLQLFTAEQCFENGVPRVRFNVREVTKAELTETEDGLALVGVEFAEDNKGWALVLVRGERCSSQGLVTRCSTYQGYTTEEALQAAAESYGGLTDDISPSPQD